MQTVEPDIGLEPLAALQSSAATNSEVVLMALLNEIASLSQSLALILDDYHVIESQSIDQALTFLLDRLPATMHIVITTRIDPPCLWLVCVGESSGILLLTIAVNFREIGDIAQASQSYADAVTLLLAAENIVAAIMAVDQLVRLLVMQGKLVQAVEVCQEMLDASAQFSAPEQLWVLSSDMARANMSHVLYERNGLAEAEVYVRQGIKQTKQGGFLQSLIVGHILLARILQAQGDADGANKMLQA